MAHFPVHEPAKWEFVRVESDEHRTRRLATEKQTAEVDEHRRETGGHWWANQRYVNQVVPSDLVHPTTFDNFNYGYQLYARQTPQRAPVFLSEATDQKSPLRYNVKRIAIDKPCDLGVSRCCQNRVASQPPPPAISSNWDSSSYPTEQTLTRRQTEGTTSRGSSSGNAQNNFQRAYSSEENGCAQAPACVGREICCGALSDAGSEVSSSCTTVHSANMNNCATQIGRGYQYNNDNYNYINSNNNNIKNSNNSNSNNNNKNKIDNKENYNINNENNNENNTSNNNNNKNYSNNNNNNDFLVLCDAIINRVGCTASDNFVEGKRGGYDAAPRDFREDWNANNSQSDDSDTDPANSDVIDSQFAQPFNNFSEIGEHQNEDGGSFQDVDVTREGDEGVEYQTVDVLGENGGCIVVVHFEESDDDDDGEEEEDERMVDVEEGKKEKVGDGGDDEDKDDDDDDDDDKDDNDVDDILFDADDDDDDEDDDNNGDEDNDDDKDDEEDEDSYTAEDVAHEKIDSENSKEIDDDVNQDENDDNDGVDKSMNNTMKKSASPLAPLDGVEEDLVVASTTPANDDGRNHVVGFGLGVLNDPYDINYSNNVSKNTTIIIIMNNSGSSNDSKSNKSNNKNRSNINSNNINNNNNNDCCHHHHHQQQQQQQQQQPCLAYQQHPCTLPPTFYSPNPDQQIPQTETGHRHVTSFTGNAYDGNNSSPAVQSQIQVQLLSCAPQPNYHMSPSPVVVCNGNNFRNNNNFSYNAAHCDPSLSPYQQQHRVGAPSSSAFSSSGYPGSMTAVRGSHDTQGRKSGGVPCRSSHGRTDVPHPPAGLLQPDNEDSQLNCQALQLPPTSTTQPRPQTQTHHPSRIIPGYGTYKIIGGLQYREAPSPDIKNNMELPQHLKEYRNYLRRCPNVRFGVYDKSDSRYEPIFPSNMVSTLIPPRLSPFQYSRSFV